MRNRIILTVLIFVILISLYTLISNIKICTITPYRAEEVYEQYENKISENEDICIIEKQDKGKWLVIKSTDRQYENKSFVLSSTFDIDDLKIAQNKYFYDFAKFLVVTKKCEKGVLIPKEIIISNYYYRTEGYDYLKLKDLSFKGKCDFICSFLEKNKREVKTVKKRYIFLIIIISVAVIIAGMVFIKPINSYIKKTFVNIILTQMDKEEAQRQKKIENNEIVAGKDTALIWENTYEIWNHMGEKHISIQTVEPTGVILKKITEYKKTKDKLYIVSEEGYAVIDKNKLCRVFVTVPDEEFVNGYSEDKEGNRTYFSRRIENKYIKYLSDFDEFSKEEKDMLNKLKK